MANERDYYEVLGVSKSASEDEIKKAQKLLVKKIDKVSYEGVCTF